VADEALLRAALAVAVPVWIDQLWGAGQDHRLERAQVCAQVVAEHGDDVLYRSKRRGASAEAFNRLAEGIACAAFSPGGVRAFGSRWEAR
jgi:hypothetical protein